MRGYLEEPGGEEQGQAGHEGHEEGGEPGHRQDGGHEAELHAAGGEEPGEDVAGEDAAQEEAGEAEGPDEGDGGGVGAQVVRQVRLHRTWPLLGYGEVVCSLIKQFISGYIILP